MKKIECGSLEDGKQEGREGEMEKKENDEKMIKNEV